MTAQEGRLVHGHHAAAARALAVLDDSEHVRHRFGAQPRIGINEEQPIAGGGFASGIAGSGNLIDRLEDHHCSRPARQLGGASVELLSATMTSLAKSGRGFACSALNTLCTHAAMRLASLNAGMTMDSFIRF